ncbi:DUF6167 family protein [Nocardioides alcanivorans]|uniref:DUF6167 family protein n=1 Tax=Nocardioides alcanivorans TaxID=2897352 RepID=UPI001F3EAE70|nr:DUF6167 family protein [Nocardioides alcanivorans]
MRRGFWFAAGAGAGIYAVNRARRFSEGFTAAGIRDRVQALKLGARLVRDDVAQASADREVELRERLGLAPAPAHRTLSGPSARPQLTQHRTTRQRGTN